MTFITDEATQDPTQFISLAAELGIDGLELRTVHDRPVWLMDSSERTRLKAALADASLKTCCLDTPIFKCDFPGSSEGELQKLATALESARSLEADRIRVFSFWRSPERETLMPDMITTLKRASRMAADASVHMLVENGRRTMHSSGKEIASLMEHLEPAWASVLWDPGNSVFSGVDLRPLENGFRHVARRLGHVHIKDMRFYTQSHPSESQVDSSDLDVERQIRMLHETGYSAYVSLETHWRPRRTISFAELDAPGGSSFSKDGFDATAQGLRLLKPLIEREGVHGP